MRERGLLVQVCEARLLSKHPAGTLAMHWTSDHLLLWQAPVTRASLVSAHIYYVNTLVNMSQRFHLLYSATATSGVALLVSKALSGRESNWLFDGASLCA